MTRIWASTLIGLSCGLTLLAGGLAHAFTTPIDEVSLRWCVNEVGETYNHVPLIELDDGEGGTVKEPHRNRVDGSTTLDRCFGGDDPSFWESNILPEPGDTVQLDFFFKLNNQETIQGVQIGVSFDEEDNLLDFQALNTYNVSATLQSPAGEHPCTPYPSCSGVKRSMGMLNFNVDDTFDSGDPYTRFNTTGLDNLEDSEPGSPGLIPWFSGLTVPGANGPAGPKAGAEIRIGSIWFKVNDVEGTAVVWPGLFVLGGGIRNSTELLGFNDDWENELTWTSAEVRVPEPASALLRFASISLLGWIVHRRRS